MRKETKIPPPPPRGPAPRAPPRGQRESGEWRVQSVEFTHCCCVLAGERATSGGGDQPGLQRRRHRAHLQGLRQDVPRLRRQRGARQAQEGPPPLPDQERSQVREKLSSCSGHLGLITEKFFMGWKYSIYNSAQIVYRERFGMQVDSRVISCSWIILCCFHFCQRANCELKVHLFL